MNLNLSKAFWTFINKRKDQEKVQALIRKMETQKWLDKLCDLGFKEISFPIFIVSNEWDGIYLTLVDDLEEFAIDADLHYFPWDYDSNILDSKGNLWTWKYDENNKTNLPGSLIQTLSLEEVKEKINKGFIGYKSENEIKSIVNNASSIHGLFKSLPKFNF